MFELLQCIWPAGYKDLQFFERDLTKTSLNEWESFGRMLNGTSSKSETSAISLECLLYTPPVTPGDDGVSKETLLPGDPLHCSTADNSQVSSQKDDFLDELDFLEDVNLDDSVQIIEPPQPKSPIKRKSDAHVKNTKEPSQKKKKTPPRIVRIETIKTPIELPSENCNRNRIKKNHDCKLISESKNVVETKEVELISTTENNIKIVVLEQEGMPAITVAYPNIEPQLASSTTTVLQSASTRVLGLIDSEKATRLSNSAKQYKKFSFSDIRSNKKEASVNGNLKKATMSKTRRSTGNIVRDPKTSTPLKIAVKPSPPVQVQKVEDNSRLANTLSDVIECDTPIDRSSSELSSIGSMKDGLNLDSFLEEYINNEELDTVSQFDENWLSSLLT